MAALLVRSRSRAFARLVTSHVVMPVERTRANWRECSPIFAMQKVVGSSPIIRSEIPAKWRSLGRLVLLAVVQMLLHVTAGAKASAPPSTRSVRVGHYLFATRGLDVQFERRGWSSGYNPGEVLQKWNEFDNVVGSTVEAEVARQLDHMKALGVNEIWYPLPSSDEGYDPNFVPPACPMPEVLGLRWPQPTPTELTSLGAFFDLLERKGVKVILELQNNHMEDQTDSARWLGAILDVVKDKPALDLVQFDGNLHTLDLNGDGIDETCGVPSEAPLWLGATSRAGSYVRFAIALALAKGLPAQKLSAESIVGNYFTDSHPVAYGDATDGHFWAPVESMKAIFDSLGVPPGQRTYALSFYEHRKCNPAIVPSSYPCVDADPQSWAEESLRRVRDVVVVGPRLVASEMGGWTPVEGGWPTADAVEGLVSVFQRYHVNGGAFWRWTNFNNSEDGDPSVATPVKRRGAAYTYNAIVSAIRDMDGFHLDGIVNGSFEDANGTGRPTGWSVTGRATRLKVSGEPGARSWRGSYVLRLGPEETAATRLLRVSPRTTYTLAFDRRGGPASVSVRYMACRGARLARGRRAVVFKAPRAPSFARFAVTFATPSQACLARVVFAAKRTSLELDYVR